MRAYLKIKVKSLAAEAKIIRQEEMKYRNRTSPISKAIRVGLYLHRINHVRTECRSANLAMAFLRDMPYRKVEHKCHTLPDFSRVESLCLKYGDQDSRILKQKFEEWKQGTPIISEI